MTQPNRDRDRITERFSNVGRRTFIAAGSAVSAALLAGCASESSPADTDEESTDDETDDSTGTNGENFRLLVSDMPADIGDFDRLDVTLDYARIFDGGGEGEDEDEDEQPEDGDESGDEQPDGDESDAESEDGDETGEESADDGDDADETAPEDEEADESEEADDGDDAGVERKRGFYILDLEGATVDLTQVVGEKAVSVFEGELSAGTYEKIELHVSAVEGIVDGEPVDVKLPSEKLQITHPFEIGDDDPVDFVFDINVVKRGNENGYILKPVISESGVAGKDVDVEEIDEDRDDEGDDTEEADDRDGDEDDDTEEEDERDDEEAQADSGADGDDTDSGGESGGDAGN